MNITGPKDMSAHEMSDAASIIHEEAGDDADIISGIVTDPDIQDEIRVTVIATGIDNNELGMPNNDNNPLQDIHLKDEKEIQNSLPTYKQKELESEDSSIEVTKDKNILSFGDDDLDIPAFIRNRKH